MVVCAIPKFRTGHHVARLMSGAKHDKTMGHAKNDAFPLRTIQELPSRQMMNSADVLRFNLHHVVPGIHLPSQLCL